MFRLSHPVLRSLLIGFLTVQSLVLVFSQRLDTTPDPIIPEAGESLQMTLGHDSPNLGGNVFRNAYVSLTLTNAIGIEAGKLIVEISFPNQGEIEFERAELTPDPKASGAVVEVELDQAEGVELAPQGEASGAEVEIELDQSEGVELAPQGEATGAVEEVAPAPGEETFTSVRIIISSENPLPEGIIGNLVFKVTKEFSPEDIGAEDLLVTLESKTSAWTTDGQEIAQVVSGPGGIDLDYAPVVFACLFYMH
ncbi:MAG: hypothetical protein O6826_00485 [Acidobacteria bacterium]|nr:hypothetical protein [Acidobacteriota bacterium]